MVINHSFWHQSTQAGKAKLSSTILWVNDSQITALMQWPRDSIGITTIRHACSARHAFGPTVVCTIKNHNSSSLSPPLRRRWLNVYDVPYTLSIRNIDAEKVRRVLQNLRHRVQCCYWDVCGNKDLHGANIVSALPKRLYDADVILPGGEWLLKKASFSVC